MFSLSVHAGHAPQNFSVHGRKRACPVKKLGLPYFFLKPSKEIEIATNEITRMFIIVERFDALLKNQVLIKNEIG